MAVKEDGVTGPEVLQQGQACTELIDEESIGLETGKFARGLYL